eukprot:774254-Pelagomonas_calceolata.AAC.1
MSMPCKSHHRNSEEKPKGIIKIGANTFKVAEVPLKLEISNSVIRTAFLLKFVGDLQPDCSADRP